MGAVGIETSVKQRLVTSSTVLTAHVLHLSSVGVEQEAQRLLQLNSFLDPEGRIELPQEIPIEAFSGEVGYVEGYPESLSGVESLKQYLWNQVIDLGLGERDLALIGVLIDALDERGFLAEDLLEVQNGFSAEVVVSLSLDDLSAALVLLQSLDPVGVGARDLQGCFRIQLSRMDAGREGDLAMCLLVGCQGSVEKLRDNHWLMQQPCFTKQTQKVKHRVIRLLQSLNPMPCAGFEPSGTDYVIPDFQVSKCDGGWHLSLNEQILPKVGVNQAYIGAVSAHSVDAALKREIQQACFFVDNLQRRYQTLYRIVKEILRRQDSFLEQGFSGMKPLSMQEVADTLDLHLSTVSRAVAQKFLATPVGVVELRMFFDARALQGSKDRYSAASVLCMIKQMVEVEDCHHPLSDRAIAEQLEQQSGVSVSRRTVSKYRDSLEIPPANRRRKMAK